ncbi:hypothetical protein E0D86_10005 [Pseudomonas sp. IC_126]|uniref:hypothetical protein n=1 Tax=Pseudomonas sp. IC_126 TaxID=2547400 RepID=UPI0010389B19|nr:hypothetical protein [Pseudomonas sp. IC_126]TCD22953.1 hypothetical protein E0D86_10005 [Pseudomonas sp. IC_126]
MSEKINHIKWLLVDQIYDLTTPIVQMRKNLADPDFDIESKEALGQFRLCNHAIIISLFKLHEILKVYGKEINEFPTHVKVPLQKLRAEIEKREICIFRNKYAAHIIDDNTGKPVSLKKGGELLEKIAGKNIAEMLNFYEWVYPKNGCTTNNCIIPAVQSTLEHCKNILGSGWERP